jgi:hypothetical protein
LLRAIEKLTRQTLPLIDKRGEVARAALPSGESPPAQRNTRANNQNKPFHQGRQAPRAAAGAGRPGGGAARQEQRPKRRATRRPFPGGETARA